MTQDMIDEFGLAKLRLGGLFGREHDVCALTLMVYSPDVRLITLTGPGGVGKTRLALQLAQDLATDFGDGVVFVPLAAINDPAYVISAIASACNVLVPQGNEAAARLGELLNGRQLLLILDNFEQITDAATDIAEILEQAESVKVVVTSRFPLHLSGE